MRLAGYSPKSMRWCLHLDAHTLTCLVGAQSLMTVTRGGTSGKLFDHCITSVYLGPFSLTYERVWEKGGVIDN